MRRLNGADRASETLGAKRRGAKGRPPARRRPWPRGRRRRLLWGGLGTAAAAIAGAAAWLVIDGWFTRQTTIVRAAAIEASAGLGFTVERVLADGRSQTSSGDILAALGVRIGQPILALDLEAARARLAGLPWVESATVERRLPDTLYVRVSEAEPLVLWQQQQRLHLISRSGRVIEGAPIERFANLLVVVGADAPAHAAALLDMLATQPDLRRRVTAAVRVGGRRWNLHFDNGIDVKLPEADSAAAWAELARLERDYGLLARDLTVIDLRLPDRLLVHLAPSAVRRDKPAGNDT
jgi:cell division protein FtsQ